MTFYRIICLAKNGDEIVTDELSTLKKAKAVARGYLNEYPDAHKVEVLDDGVCIWDTFQKQAPIPCGYRDCAKPIPPTYGEPGVSLSRLDGRTLICSACGTREAFGNVAPSLLNRAKADV